jgi:hypothetical protein
VGRRPPTAAPPVDRGGRGIGGRWTAGAFMSEHAQW